MNLRATIRFIVKCLLSLIAGLLGILLFTAIWFLMPVQIGRESAYFNIDEKINIPRFMTIRLEGKLYEEIGIDFIGYLIKYKWHRKETFPWKKSFFSVQKELQKKWLEEWDFTDQGISLGAVGDIMWIRTDWERFLTEEVRYSLEQFDFLTGNLETNIDFNLPSIPRFLPDSMFFNSPQSYLKSFRKLPNDQVENVSKRSMFSVLSFANNHMYDFGETSAVETSSFLQKEGIGVSGFTAPGAEDTVKIIDIQGVRIGFVAVTYGYNNIHFTPKITKPNLIKGLAPSRFAFAEEEFDFSLLRKALSQMEDSSVDFKVVSVHWGFENESYPADLTIWAGREIAKMGADVVLGSHPHLIQPSEICMSRGDPLLSKLNSKEDRDSILQLGCFWDENSKKKNRSLIIYSLGNFTSNIWSWEARVGMISKLKIFKNVDGRIQWAPQEAELIFNEVSWWENRHRLVKLETFLRENCNESTADCREISKVKQEIESLQIVEKR